MSLNSEIKASHPKNPLKPVILGIAGGSASGKSTFALKLQAMLIDSGLSCSVIGQDSYYIDQSSRFTGDGESVNFDHPSALDFPLMAEHIRSLALGKSVEVPIYDYSTHKRLAVTRSFDAPHVLIVDGFLIYHEPRMRELMEHRLFLETGEEVRFQRRLHRDLKERGRSADGVRKQFERQVKPMHDAYVEPTKQFATHVYSGEGDFSDSLYEIASRVLHQVDDRCEMFPQIVTERLVISSQSSVPPRKVLDYYTRENSFLAPTSPTQPPDFLTLPFHEKRMVQNAADMKNDRSYRFIIQLKDQPESVIGTASLTAIMRGPGQSCYLGYGLSEKLQGKGLMTEACRAIVGFAFKTLKLHRVMANHLPENLASAKVLSKIGFKREGYAEKYLLIDGQWRDHVLNAVSEESWPS